MLRLSLSRPAPICKPVPDNGAAADDRLTPLPPCSLKLWLDYGGLPTTFLRQQRRSNMQKRPLGSTGLNIAPLVLGGNVFGWTIDEKQSFAVLDAFVDQGFNAIDTADMYSTWAPGNKGGESETIIGSWLKRTGKRDKVVIATKLGLDMGPGKKGLSRNYIFRAVEASLQRLQTDYIDLYQSHTDDTETPLEETLSAYADLIKEGKVRVIGASNYGGDRLAEALKISQQHGLPRYESLQPLYNLYDRADYETNLEPVC